MSNAVTRAILSKCVSRVRIDAPFLITIAAISTPFSGTDMPLFFNS